VPWSPTSPDSLVGDSGNPAAWPAAQPTPPSLAGAYSTNMIKVIVTLVRYEDWVGSHPDPALVPNYMIKGGNAYASEVKLITWLQKRGWHTDPSPTEIDWASVTAEPRAMPLVNGEPAQIRGHRLYMPGAAVNVVLDLRVGELLNRTGQVVGHSSVTPGKAAFSEILAQGMDGRWRISSIYPLKPRGGLAVLAR
jgi:hypothetical protein